MNHSLRNVRGEDAHSVVLVLKAAVLLNSRGVVAAGVWRRELALDSDDLAGFGDEEGVAVQLWLGKLVTDDHMSLRSAVAECAVIDTAVVGLGVWDAEVGELGGQLASVPVGAVLLQLPQAIRYASRRFRLFLAAIRLPSLLLHCAPQLDTYQGKHCR